MSAGVDSGSGGKSGSQDFDLNLAPIIDCFTVLITFLLASASFLSIGILSTSPGVASAAAAGAKPPPVNVEVMLNPGFEINIKVTGKENHEKKLPAAQGDWDLKALLGEVDDLKRRWPETQSLVLSAANDIEYLNVVRVMESLRPKIPAVLLGGL